MTPISFEHLTDGLSSPFWEWFSEHVTREWGPSGLLYQRAVRDAAQSPNAVIELQKVLYAQEAIHALMQHPANELKRHKEQRRMEDQGFSVSRRGPGL